MADADGARSKRGGSGRRFSSWRFAWMLGLLMASAPALAQQGAFPFDSELFLDARPMAGSKRIPNMDISARGAIAVEMWCNRVEGQVVVAGDTVTVLAGAPTSRTCSPQEAERDAAFLATLNAVTNWRREGDTLVLTGPTETLRFKTPTH